jgi:predicted deacylase
MARPISRCIRLARVLALGGTGTAPLTAQSPFPFADTACAPGSRCRTHLVVPAAGGDSAVRLPVTIVHGARPGPLLAVTAGVHGGEYAPVIASQQLVGALDPARLRGTVLIVHSTNPVSFFGRGVYYTPSDGRNLNRMFPGTADGTLSERTAHVVFTQVMQRADVYLDLHGGDANEALRPYVATRVTGDSAFDARIRALARATGLELLVETPVPTPIPTPAGTTTMASVVNRIAGFTIEWGMLGRVDQSAVDGQVRAVLGVAHAMGMEQGRALRGGGRVVLAGSRTATAPVSGLVRVTVALDQVVQAGERVATISDLFGVHLADVVAPATGRVIAYTATPPVRAGEPVVAVGVLATQR